MQGNYVIECFVILFINEWKRYSQPRVWIVTQIWRLEDKSCHSSPEHRNPIFSLSFDYLSYLPRLWPSGNWGHIHCKSTRGTFWNYMSLNCFPPKTFAQTLLLYQPMKTSIFFHGERGINGGTNRHFPQTFAKTKWPNVTDGHIDRKTKRKKVLEDIFFLC